MNWDEKEAEMTLSVARIHMLQTKAQLLVNELSGSKSITKLDFGTRLLLHMSLIVPATPHNMQKVKQLKKTMGALLREQTQFCKKYHDNNS